MSNRRRILKVKHKFQDQMILEIILVAFVFINVLVIASFFAIESIRDLFTLKFTLAVALAIGELGGIAIVYFYTLKASHKIAGPIYMIERRLKEIADGDLTVQLHLRKGDHFHDTSGVLNDCIVQLREKIGAVRKAAVELQQSTGQSSAAQAQLDSLFKALDAFKLEHSAAADKEPG